MKHSRLYHAAWFCGLVAYFALLLAYAWGCQHVKPVPDHSQQLAAPFDKATGQLKGVKDALSEAAKALGTSPVVATVNKAVAGVDATLATLAQGKADSAKIAAECKTNAERAAAFDKYLKDHYNDKFGPWTHRWFWRIVIGFGVLSVLGLAFGYWRGFTALLPVVGVAESLLKTIITGGAYLFARFGHWLANKIHKPQAIPAATAK